VAAVIGARRARGGAFQRDTAAYAGLYNADTTGRWPPPGSGRQITAEALKEKLDEAHRYRDHRPAFIRVGSLGVLGSAAVIASPRAW
jgi:hypothetical protein